MLYDAYMQMTEVKAPLMALIAAGRWQVSGVALVWLPRRATR